MKSQHLVQIPALPPPGYVTLGNYFTFLCFGCHIALEVRSSTLCLGSGNVSAVREAVLGSKHEH